MELVLKRIAKKDTYTIGKLYINGEYFCDTLEDTDRGLTSEMSMNEIYKIKIAGKTAIPSGNYTIKLTKSIKFKKVLPLLLDVPGFSGVRIHSGNTAEDTEGCLLLGENKIKGKLINSLKTMLKFMAIIKNAQNINITIE